MRFFQCVIGGGPREAAHLLNKNVIRGQIGSRKENFSMGSVAAAAICCNKFAFI